MTAEINPKQTLLKVTSSAALVQYQFIQVNKEVMRVEEIDNTNVIVSRGQYGTEIVTHNAGDVLNLINANDNTLIEVGDDFGFDSDIEFFGDLKSYSPSQGTDI